MCLYQASSAGLEGIECKGRSELRFIGSTDNHVIAIAEQLRFERIGSIG
jgi:hypothetical protein